MVNEAPLFGREEGAIQMAKCKLCTNQVAVLVCWATGIVPKEVSHCAPPLVDFPPTIGAAQGK